MKSYNIFNETGEFLCIYQGNSPSLQGKYFKEISLTSPKNPVFLQLPEEEVLIKPLNPVSHLATIKGDGVSPIVLYNVPSDAVVTLGEESLISDGTEIELFFDIPGEYSLSIECFPYLRYEVTLHAT